MIETYSPLSSRVKTYQVVGDQTPEFAKAENPLLEEFLKQYYISQEHQGGSLDIGENIDKYIKVDEFTDLIEEIRVHTEHLVLRRVLLIMQHLHTIILYGQQMNKNTYRM